VQLFFRAIAALAVSAVLAAYLGGVNAGAFRRGHAAVTFVDRTGAPLGTILGSDSQHAVSVPLERVSPYFVSAILAAEDSRFYGHGAVDLPAFVRAVRDAVVFGEVRSGGSTIAMQLARLLHPNASTVRGKLLQVIEGERLALRSEKRALLDAYVNRAPMGGDIYGVEAAARTYFGEPASDLDLAQATLLAAIPNDPSHLSPDVDLHSVQVRRRYVLDRMVALGYATQAQADAATRETLHVARHDSGIDDAAHALFALYPRVSSSGLVRTTIDRGLQRFVQAQARDVVAALVDRHVTDAAALVVDNHSGEVLAYVGSPDYFSDEALGRNDGVQALRQPGSSLKPFTYELALERGAISPTTILPDVPSSFALPGGKLYQPADYSGRFSGPVRVRFALANSLNVPAVRVLSQIGPESLLERLHELGFTHLDKPASYYGLGLTLGGGEVTLWELERAYVTLARGGNAIPLRLLASGAPALAHSIGDAPTWALVTNILADSHARARSFGLHSVLDMPFDAAVKTGTSSDFRDTWTVGYTRDYTVGVWVGNFDGSAMRSVSGVTGAGPLWNRIMLHLHESNEPANFAPPRGFIQTPICATTGHAPDAGCAAVVQEWVRPSDLAFVRRPAAAQLGHDYDAWLAHQPRAASDVLRIVAPQDGTVYYRNATATVLQAQEQAIALRAIGNRGSVHWSVGGRELALDSEGHAFLPVRLGAWTITARDSLRSTRVTIRVFPAPQHARPGFSRTDRSSANP
jgi:penicillin-binding protein 1C